MTCNFIHSMGFVFFILFMALSTSYVNSGISSVSGLDSIVLFGVGTVWVQTCRNLHIFLEFLLSDILSPDSFLELIIVCLLYFFILWLHF